jgi:ATP-dependent RNA helicase DDX56/DBP9
LSLSSLESLVIDEADLILSYGHDEDVRQIFSGAFFPKVYQSFLMSATMTEDVEMLKGLTLRNPVSLVFIIIFLFLFMLILVRLS